jgi:3-hydroxypropanoate dehydrogenase
MTTTMPTGLTDVLALDPEAQDLLFREARTANAFSDEPVTDEQVQAIYDLVRWGPTAMNSQPLRVVVLRSEEAKARLLPHMAEGNRAKTGRAPAVAVLAMDVDFHEELPRTFPHAEGLKERLDGDEDARRAVGLLNAGLQAGYAIIGIRAAGLAAGPMTGLDADGVSREFFPDGRHQVICVINVGRPAEDAWRERLPRLPFEDAVSVL